VQPRTARYCQKVWIEVAGVSPLLIASRWRPDDPRERRRCDLARVDTRLR
jgi:hypothetical protein